MVDVFIAIGLILLGMEIAGGIIEYLTIRRAPFGYEDEDGFHFGDQRRA